MSTIVKPVNGSARTVLLRGALALKLLLAGVLCAASGIAAACSDLPLTLANFNEFAGATFLFEDEATVMNLTPTIQYFQISTVNTTTGQFSGIVVLATGTYAMSGSVAQVGVNGLSFQFSFSTNPTLPAAGTTYTYTGAIQVASNCIAYFAGTYSGTYIIPVGKFPHVGTVGPLPFSGYAYP